MSAYVQTNQPVVVPDLAAYAVNASNTGKIFLIGPLSQACTITLPALSAGLHYRFLNTVAAIGFNVSIRGVADGNVYGTLTIVGATPVAGIGEKSVNFLTAAATQGDFIDLYCDGTQWSAFGVGKVAGSLSFTAP